jgi:rubrerythrin
MNRVIEQVSRDERNHARIAAAVVTQVKNESIDC